jgi:hypothetical protein
VVKVSHLQRSREISTSGILVVYSLLKSEEKLRRIHVKYALPDFHS